MCTRVTAQDIMGLYGQRTKWGIQALTLLILVCKGLDQCQKERPLSRAKGI